MSYLGKKASSLFSYVKNKVNCSDSRLFPVDEIYYMYTFLDTLNCRPACSITAKGLRNCCMLVIGLKKYLSLLSNFACVRN